MAVFVTDAIIRVRNPDGTRTVGIHEVLFHAQSGSLIDFPGMRADQRAPVVTALAIISHLLRRYAPSPLATTDDWLKASLSQFGDGALVLAGGSDHEPQFLQPVLVGLGEIKPFNITESDHLMAANRHVLKVADEATAEAALFSLIASTWRHHGGVGNPAGARARLLTVLVGDGLTIASEIASLTAAYDATAPHVVGIHAATFSITCCGRNRGKRSSRSQTSLSHLLTAAAFDWFPRREIDYARSWWPKMGPE
jgi:hypothetical protein